MLEDEEYNRFLYMSYEPMSDAQGRRIFGKVNSGTFWQINAHAVGAENVLITLALFVDGSFVRAHIPVEPVLGKCPAPISPLFCAIAAGAGLTALG